MYFECFAQSLYAGFYVGAYGLVANFSAPSQRAQRFARMDALSLLAFTFSVAVGENAYNSTSDILEEFSIDPMTGKRPDFPSHRILRHLRH